MAPRVAQAFGDGGPEPVAVFVGRQRGDMVGGAREGHVCFGRVAQPLVCHGDTDVQRRVEGGDALVAHGVGVPEGLPASARMPSWHSFSTGLFRSIVAPLDRTD